MKLGALNKRGHVTLRQTLFSTQCGNHELVENDHMVIFLGISVLKEIPSHAVEIKVPSVPIINSTQTVFIISLNNLTFRAYVSYWGHYVIKLT